MGDPLENLLRSNVFKSDLVVKEFASVINDLMMLSRMSTKFPDFDLEGKKMFLQQLEDSADRYRVFIKRLELSEDAAAKEYLRFTNAQMLEGGFTMPVMFRGMMDSLAYYRQWVQAEEAASVDPIKHQKFLKEFRAQWGQTALGKINLDRLSSMSNPEIIMRAQRDPEFYKAIKEISDNPTSATMSKWMDNPNIGPLVAEIWKSMQGS